MRQLPDKAYDILSGEHAKHSPWASVQAVAMHALNAGWNEEQFTEAVMASDLAEVFASENGRDRSDRLSARLAKAWNRAEADWTPPIGGQNNVREQLAGLSQRLADRKWTGRTASTDRAVALALVAWAHEVGVWTLDAGARELGLRAGVGMKTASRALERLAALGLISKDETRTRQGTHAQRWVLNTGYGLSGQSDTHDYSLRGERFMCVTTTTNSPAFLNGALGQTAERVWLDLAEHPDATAAEVSERTGVSVQSLRKRVMPKLITHELIIESGAKHPSGRGRPASTYWLNPDAPSLESIAEQFGVLDWHERTTDRIERERDGFAEVQRQKAEKAKERDTGWSQEVADQINRLMQPPAA